MSGTTPRQIGRQTARCATGILVGALSLGLVATPVAAHAQVIPTTSSVAAVALPAALFKKKKKKKKKKKASKPAPGLTPDGAETKRQAIRDSVAADIEGGNLEAAASGLEDNGALLGDPITIKQAGELRLKVAKEERSIEKAEASIEVTVVALDILHFYAAVADGEANSDWLVIDPSSASGLISEAEAQIAEAEALIAEIEAEQAEEDEPVASAGGSKKKDKKKKGKMKPGTGFIIGGSVATAVGAAGVGLAMAGLFQSRSAQNEVEDLGGDPANQPRIEELDEEGAKANRLSYIGIGVAAAGLAIGIPLIIVGAKKRKEAGPSSNASVQLAPMVAGRVQGLSFSGRF